jgi:Ca2+-binding EF-hand superfamily protein
MAMANRLLDHVWRFRRTPRSLFMKSIRLVAGLLVLAPLSLPLLAQTTTPAAPTVAPAHAGHAGDAKAGQRGMHRGMRHHGGLERLDTDNDGRISRAEFTTGQAAMEQRKAAHPQSAGKVARAPLDFAAIDSNRDGYLVRTELRAYHERMRPQHEAARKARFDAKFAEADLNRDGKLSRVEVGEKMPRMADRFAWMDDNRDGFLSQAELQSQRAQR